MYGEVRTRTTEARPGPRVALMPLRECPKIDLANTDEPPRMALPSEPVDVLLWSERAFGHTILDVRSQSDEFWNVCLDDQITDGSEKRVLEKAASVADAVLFVGADRLVERADGTYAYCNCLACFNPRSGYAGASDKKYLVPFTERVPLSNGFDMRRGQFVPGEEYPLFECSRRETGERFRCAAAICYDAAFPAVFYLSRYEEPPQFFLVASAESFERTGRLQACVLQAARFRAIENRRAIVRNVQGGRSGLIDSAGRYQSTELPWEITRPVALSHVPIDDRFSLYAVVGDWVPLVCLLVVLFRVTRMLLGRGLADCTL
jgi:apolipoprotein N-acyltransferase